MKYTLADKIKTLKTVCDEKIRARDTQLETSVKRAKPLIRQVAILSELISDLKIQHTISNSAKTLNS